LTSLIRRYKDINLNEIDRAFSAGSKLFLDNWINYSRTPTSTERIRFMADYLDVRLSEEHIYEALSFFGQMIFEIPPQEIDFVKEMIPQVSKKYPLGIISDTGYISGYYIRNFLEKENLIKYFSSFIFSDENIYSKPHQSVFNKTAMNLGIPIQDLMHIGDLERTDITGAIDAGCIAVKFIGANHDIVEKSRAHYIISDYHDFLELII
jgi:HAD superfamily hydrolase (TIGR01549 family)